MSCQQVPAGERCIGPFKPEQMHGDQLAAISYGRAVMMVMRRVVVITT